MCFCTISSMTSGRRDDSSVESSRARQWSSSKPRDSVGISIVGAVMGMLVALRATLALAARYNAATNGRGGENPWTSIVLYIFRAPGKLPERRKTYDALTKTRGRNGSGRDGWETTHVTAAIAFWGVNPLTRPRILRTHSLRLQRPWFLEGFNSGPVGPLSNMPKDFREMGSFGEPERRVCG